MYTKHNVQTIMKPFLTQHSLWKENKLFRRTGGVSHENRRFHFEPAFRDQETGMIYPSCHGDGSPAPCHLLDGLPPSLAVTRDGSGHVTAVKSSVVAGFTRGGHFYTREEAAQAVETQPSWLKRHLVVGWLNA